MRVFDGEIKAEDEIEMIVNKVGSDVIEVGYFKPDLRKAAKISAGEIGYIATGLRAVEECKVGDTIALEKDLGKVKALPGYKEVKPMVYASFYPIEGDDYNLMMLFFFCF